MKLTEFNYERIFEKIHDNRYLDQVRIQYKPI